MPTNCTRHCRRRLWLAISITGFVQWNLVYAEHEPSKVAEYEYTAITEAPAATLQGAVQAGELTWHCKANQCTITGPWPRPGLKACSTLADKVGALRSYGQPLAMLNDAYLKNCNTVTAKTSASTSPRQVSAAGSNLLSGLSGRYNKSTVAHNTTEKPTSTANDPNQFNCANMPKPQTIDSTLLNNKKIPGPVIVEFKLKKNSCPYPDAMADILSYALRDSPDGTRVERVNIVGEYPGGQKASVFRRDVSNDRLAVNPIIYGAAKNCTVHADSGQIRAFTLIATDAKGRSSTRSIPWSYWSSQPEAVRGNWYERDPHSQQILKGGNVKHYFHFNISDLNLGDVSTTLWINGIEQPHPVQKIQKTLFLPIGEKKSVPWEMPTGYIGLRQEEFTLEYTDSYLLEYQRITNIKDNMQFQQYKLEFRLIPDKPDSCSDVAILPSEYITPLHQEFTYDALGK